MARTVSFRGLVWPWFIAIVGGISIELFLFQVIVGYLFIIFIEARFIIPTIVIILPPVVLSGIGSAAVAPSLKAFVAVMVPSASFVVLAQDEVERLDDCSLLQSGCTQGDQLSLVLCQCGTT